MNKMFEFARSIKLLVTKHDWNPPLFWLALNVPECFSRYQNEFWHLGQKRLHLFKKTTRFLTHFWQTLYSHTFSKVYLFFFCKDHNIHSQLEQESPPAWTQEAYRPPYSKYSLYCPNWVAPPSWLGRGGYPAKGGYLDYEPGYPPGRVPLPPVLARGLPYLGTLPAGYPPRQGTPPVSAPWHSGKCCKALWDMGTPLGVDKLTKWNYYLPVVLRTRAVIILLTQ